MSDATDNAAAPVAGPAPKAGRGVLCAKCEHLNPLELDACEFCGGHLYVSCSECGAKNPRVGSRCVQCQRRLHKARRGSSASRSPLRRSWVLILLGVLIAGILLTVFLAGDTLRLR